MVEVLRKNRAIVGICAGVGILAIAGLFTNLIAGEVVNDRLNKLADPDKEIVKKAFDNGISELGAIDQTIAKVSFAIDQAKIDSAASRLLETHRRLCATGALKSGAVVLLSGQIDPMLDSNPDMKGWKRAFTKKAALTVLYADCPN